MTSEFDGDSTYPASDPRSRIDYVFAPSDWRHVSTRVIEESRLSDHRPVVSVFELPEAGAGVRDGSGPAPRRP